MKYKTVYNLGRSFYYIILKCKKKNDIVVEKNCDLLFINDLFFLIIF